MKLYQSLNIRNSKTSKGLYEVFDGAKQLTSAMREKEAISLFHRLNKIVKFR